MTGHSVTGPNGVDMYVLPIDTVRLARCCSGSASVQEGRDCYSEVVNALARHAQTVEELRLAEPFLRGSDHLLPHGEACTQVGIWIGDSPRPPCSCGRDEAVKALAAALAADTDSQQTART